MALEDLPAVLRIERASFPTPWPERVFRLELARSRGSCFLVAERQRPQQQVVGYLGFWHFLEEAHISTLAVDAPYRGQGIGSMLLARGLQEALRLGAQYVTLEVRVSNAAAAGLYEKFGFRVVAHKPGYYRDNGEEALVMSLDDLGESLQSYAGGVG
jgi:ribosomal-protein-alanine N-acetyltransferase